MRGPPKLMKGEDVTEPTTKPKRLNLPYSHFALPDSRTEEHCPLNQKTILTKSITSQES